MLIARDARVVDEHVDAAAARERRLHAAFDSIRVGHVKRIARRGRAEFLDDAGEPRAVAVPDAHARARRDEAPRDREAYALRAARHDRGTVLEIELVHSFTAPVMPAT